MAVGSARTGKKLVLDKCLGNPRCPNGGMNGCNSSSVSRSIVLVTDGYVIGEKDVFSPGTFLAFQTPTQPGKGIFTQFPPEK